MAESARWAEEAHRRALTASFPDVHARKAWEDERDADDKRASQNVRIRRRLEKPA